MKPLRFIAPILIAVLITLPGLWARLFQLPLAPPVEALIAGAAIFGASFLLLWACDAAQADISQGLALALVALVAVLPEYAVDMYFTWQAGRDPGSSYAHYAIANMTGANRLLIGVAWAAIAVIYWVRTRRPVRLGRERKTEIFFLCLATLYACLIPLKGSLAWYDGLVFLGIYVWYIAVTGRRPVEEAEVEGPAEILTRLPTGKRRLATGGLFLFAALVILANAEPFSEGLVRTGEIFHISKFLLVQWLAPIASEAPEFTVGIMFALRGQAGMALGSLLSAKLNQWTLLVGMIPGVYALSHGSLQHPLPMNAFQMDEILLTAAQSLLGVVILATLRLSLGQALLLFGLFMGQLVTPSLDAAFPGQLPFFPEGAPVHRLYAVMYLTAATALFIDRPHRFRGSWREVVGRQPGPETVPLGLDGEEDADDEEDEEEVRELAVRSRRG
ncbi:MAG TPA: sodium:calcium antiporter [Armatimonadota bacterium]|jgi:cation:H+ antiporter